MSDEEISIEKAYEILGLDVHATDEEVKKSFNELVLEFHPDRKKTDGEELKKIIKAKDVIDSKKTELDVISKVVKAVTENYKKIEFKKTQLLEKKNREIKKINNKFIQKSLFRIAPFAAILFIINSLKDIQPTLENLFIDQYMPSRFASEFMMFFNLSMLIMTILMIIYSLSILLRSRNEEIDAVDVDYDKQLEKLMGIE